MKLKILTITAVLLLAFTYSTDGYSQNSKKGNTKVRQVDDKKNKKRKSLKNAAKDARRNMKGTKVPPKQSPLPKASKKVEVNEVFEYMSKGQKPGLRVNIPNGDPLAIGKKWKEYLKNFGGKIKAVKGEFLSDNAVIPELSDNTVDIYSKIEAYPGGVFLKTFTDLGNGYVSAKIDQAKYNTIASIMRDFANGEAAISLQTALKREETKLLQMDEERQVLKQSAIELNKEIASYKNLINQKENMLKKNKELLLLKNRTTKEQIGKVEELKQDLNAVFDNK